MSEVKAIESIDALLGGLSAEERVRVLSWAQLKFGGAGAAEADRQPAGAGAGSHAAKSKPSKKSKTVISMDKTLNLSPSGKTSAAQFAAEKSPSNVKEKCVVAAYYLRDFVEMQQVTAQAVFTFFKQLQWPTPADLKNTLQQAGTAGWLDTADSDDIKITSMGENLIEHDLPARAKAKTK